MFSIPNPNTRTREKAGRNMAETESALRAHAERIANMHLEDAEFCIVYEDEDCEDLTEAEWRHIHDLIANSRVVLPSQDSA